MRSNLYLPSAILFWPFLISALPLPTDLGKSISNPILSIYQADAHIQLPMSLILPIQKVLLPGSEVEGFWDRSPYRPVSDVL